MAGPAGRGLVINATLLLLSLQALSQGASAPSPGPQTPPFYLGFATAAAQIEGANATDGKGPSIWDVFAATPGKTYEGETGAVADDFYHLYPQDIRVMQQLGARRFRMSVAWPRVFPSGDGALNQPGLDFYSRVVDALLAAGVEPHITLYHWDLPQALQDRFGGWGSTGGEIVPLFAAYAEEVFKTLGDRVVHWTTMNEPATFCFSGYSTGGHAPGIRSLAAAYACVHNVLAAHAAAVARFRQLVPHGRISINLNCDFGMPYNGGSTADQEAAHRKMEYMLGVFADPIYLGDYPASVKERISVLQPISSELARALNGSTDYFALNHYTTTYVYNKYGGSTAYGRGDFVETAYGPDGSAIGNRAESDWLWIVPWGFRSMLNWVNGRYQPKEIIVTENGLSVKGEDDMLDGQAVRDSQRVDFYKDYVAAATDAVLVDKVPMTGYFAWSLLDNFEWAEGYSQRFGVVRVNFTSEERTVKDSGRFLAALFGGGCNNTSSCPSVAYPVD